MRNLWEKFSQLNDLNVHKAIHSDDKPFKCESCDKRFRLIHHLRNHKKVHQITTRQGLNKDDKVHIEDK